MAKDAFYFPHDAGARNDPEMLHLRRKHGYEGIGIYWCIVEMLREANEDEYEISLASIEDIAFAGQFDAGIFDTFFKKDEEGNFIGLLQHDGRVFWSESLKRRMARFDEKRQKLSEAGKKGGRPPKKRVVKTKLKGGLSQDKARLKPGLSKENKRDKKRDISRARSNSNIDDETENVPGSEGHDRSNLRPVNRKLGDILFEYFSHLGQFQCDDWAVRLNAEFGTSLNLPALFTEMGKTYEGNQKKVHPGKEWGHFRLWCRNAMMGKEFRIQAPGGDKDSAGVDIFKSKSGRQRFVGLFKESGKTIAECVDTAAGDGSVPQSMVLQWQKDLEEYEQELKEVDGGE